MAEEDSHNGPPNPVPAFVDNVHLLGIQKALSTGDSSERIKIWQQLEATLNKFKPDFNVTNIPNGSGVTKDTEESPESNYLSLSPPAEDRIPPDISGINTTANDSSNEGEHVECNHKSPHDKPNKHYTDCGKLRNKEDSEVIDLDSDSNHSSQLDESTVLCCSESSEADTTNDQLNIEYVSASQEEVGSPDLLAKSKNKQLRDITIEITKSNLAALKKSMPNSVLNSETSNPCTSSPDSHRDEDVHVEFEIGAEISVPNTSSGTSSSKCSSPPPKPSPTKCYSSPLSKRAPPKRAHSGTRRKGECTCCHQTTIHSAMKFTTHPWLGVLICQKCQVFINSGDYTIEDGKEIFCRWCGDGGEIANCGSCEKSFCKYCLNSNLGDSTWDRILQDDNWRCYFCDRKPIQNLVDECDQLLQERSEREKLAKKDEAINRKTRRERREKARNEVEEPYSSDTTQMSVSESVETAVTPVKPISPIPEKDQDQDQVSTVEMCSDIDTDSLSLSDLDLLEPQENKRKRVRTPTLSESGNDTDKKLSDSPKPKKPVQSPKPKKSVTSKPKSKKLRINPFVSSGDEASKEATLLPVDKEGSEGDSDLFEATRMDQYEYQVGSEEEQSSSECSESELKVKKRKRESKRTKQKNSDEDLERSLRKGLKSRPRSKRKAKLISDSSASASASSSESESEESDEEKGKKKGRKKIRKLISDFKLSQTTRQAEQVEKERLQRLESNRSRHSTSIDATDATFLSDDSQDERSAEPLVLEKGADSKSSLCIPRRLVKLLKPHQKEGVLFLWESVCESMEMLRGGEGSGALLAHCMGLGKTIQVITLLDTLLNNSDKTGITKILIINPVNVLYNWKTEFDKWVPERDYFVHILESKDVLKTRIKTMEFWDREGGILLSGYDMFRNFCVGKKIKGKKKNQVFEMLVDPGAQIVVCDEGHVMRNSKSGLSKCLNLISTRRRIVLTGTPLQNNLQEYYCMTNFIKPNLLGSQTEFTNRFANPITNGQHADSTPADVRIMKQRAHILHVKLKGCVQRQDYTALTKYLPPKHEYVLSARLTNLQINLYEAFLASLEKMELFPVYTVTRRIWSHPWILKKEQQLQRTIRERRMEDDEMSDFIVSNTDDGDSDTEHKVKRKKLELLPRRHPQEKRNSKRTAVEKNRQFRDYMKNIDDIISIGSSSSKEDDDYEPDDVIIESKPVLAQDGNGDVAEELTSDCSENEADEPKDWFDEFIPPEIEVQLEHSAKLLFLFELLKEAKKLNEKVLVFSQSLQMLDLIEYYLRRPEHAWVKGVHYYRMDGSTPIDTRDASSSIFNNPKHPKVRLYLISTKAGSLGINLIAANRVVIMDASWNPTHDTQSIFRVYRFGQVKPVFIYRLIAKGTMEEKIYDRQVTKESLALRVIDEQQIGRHFTSSDLAELFRFEPDDIRYHEAKQEPEPDVKPAPVDDDLDCVEIVESSAPGSVKEAAKRPDADLVLCSILDKLQPRYLVDYHEHDSLTEHIFDEELSEEEKKAAWESYNTSKETISREYVQQVWQDKQAQLSQQQQFELARQLLSQGAIQQTPQAPPRPPVPPIHQILASSSNQSVSNKLQHQVLKQAVTRYQAIVASNPALGNVEKGNLFASIHHKITEEFSSRNLPQFNIPRPMPMELIRPMPLQVPVPRGTTHIHPRPTNMIITRGQLPPRMVRAPVPIMRPMQRGFPIHYPPPLLPAPSPVSVPVPQMLPRPPISSQQAQNQGRVTKTAVANEKSYPSFQEQTYPTPIEGINILPSELMMEHSYLPDN